MVWSKAIPASLLSTSATGERRPVTPKRKTSYSGIIHTEPNKVISQQQACKDPRGIQEKTNPSIGVNENVGMRVVMTTSLVNFAKKAPDMETREEGNSKPMDNIKYILHTKDKRLSPMVKRRGRLSYMDLERIKEANKHTEGRCKSRGVCYKSVTANKKIIAKEEFYKTASILKRFQYDPNKIYNFGERGCGINCPDKNAQDFYCIREELLKSKTLFVDAQFPPESAIYFKENSRFDKMNDIVWKRPGEIASKPSVFVDGVSRFDVKAGKLGTCWLPAAIANLTMNPALLYNVVPTDQTFDGDNYVGMFHFRFWQYGRWIDICVDDRLPTRNGELLFMKSTEENEFWSSLLEKAYAKLYGSYEAIFGGTLSEAMEDLTGGLAEQFDLRQDRPPDLYQLLCNAYKRNSIIGCTIEPDPNKPDEITDFGLVRGHAYILTKTLTVSVSTPNGPRQLIDLVRLQNPWNDGMKWRGNWRDKYHLWKLVSAAEREDADLKNSTDSEFWMSYEDFLREFHNVTICMVNPQSVPADTLTREWHLRAFEGSWVNGCTAGGCQLYKSSSFELNPQYRITVKGPDKFDSEGKSTVMIGLMQKNRSRKSTLGFGKLSLGYALYQIKSNHLRPLKKEFFMKAKVYATPRSFADSREISVQFRLCPGTYCFIPCTFEAGEEGDYLLRMYSEDFNSRIEIEENEMPLGIVDYSPKNVYDLSDEDNQAEESFNESVDENDEMYWTELKVAMQALAKKEELCLPEFDDDVYRCFVSMYDTFRVGKISETDWLELWRTIVKWNKIFEIQSAPGAFLTGVPFREALTDGGLSLNSKLLNKIMNRYGDEDGDIDLENFLICTVKLQRMMHMFDHISTDNVIHMNILHFLEYTISC